MSDKSFIGGMIAGSLLGGSNNSELERQNKELQRKMDRTAEMIEDERERATRRMNMFVDDVNGRQDTLQTLATDIYGLRFLIENNHKALNQRLKMLEDIVTDIWRAQKDAHILSAVDKTNGLLSKHDSSEKTTSDKEKIVSNNMIDDPNCPPEIIKEIFDKAVFKQMIKDKDEVTINYFVGRKIFKHPNCPASLIELVANMAWHHRDKDGREFFVDDNDEKQFMAPLACLAVKHPNCPVELLHELLDRGDYCIDKLTQSAALNPNCTLKMIVDKIKEANSYTRWVSPFIEQAHIDPAKTDVQELLNNILSGKTIYYERANKLIDASDFDKMEAECDAMYGEGKSAEDYANNA